MAKETYDILKSLIPNSVFDQWQNLVQDSSTQEPVARSVRTKNTGPYDLTNATNLAIRVDSPETIRITFPATLLLASDVADVINATLDDAIGRSDVASVFKDKVYLSSPSGYVEVMEGNSVLGIYEERDLIALLKVIAPTIHDYRLLIDDFYNRTMDIDLADDTFKKHIGDLIGHTWDYKRDVDTQVKIIKELPFVYRYKGTRACIEWIIKTHGGTSKIFEPYPYIMHYEDGILDGVPLPSLDTASCKLGGSVTAGSDIFEDSVNSPFTYDHVGCRIYIPALPGPQDGFIVIERISSSQLKLAKTSFDTSESNLFYRIIPPKAIPQRIENFEYWHQGVYEVWSTIDPSLFKEDFFRLAHPKGRLVYFVFDNQLTPVDIFDENQTYPHFLTRTRQLFYPINSQNAIYTDIGAGYEDVDGWFEGRQTLYGMYRTTYRNNLMTTRLRPAQWSQLLYWRELQGQLYYLKPYERGDVTLTELVSAGDGGYDWAIPLIDAQPDIQKKVWGYSSTITRGALSTDALPADVPIGSEVLIVNKSGTLDKENDNFTGGTTYIKDIDWEQVAGTISWLGMAAPALGQIYRVFYRFNPWEPFGMASPGVVPISGNTDSLELPDGTPIVSW